MKTALLICGVLLLAACGQGSVRIPAGKPSGNAPAANTPAEPEPAVSDEIAALRKDVAEVAARKEHRADWVEVQHILISFGGAGTTATRTRDEAEQLAAEVYAKVKSGEDFEALVREYSDDPVQPDDTTPGVYTMTSQGDAFGSRKGMVPAFGNVGWRLDVGEVGVAPYDPDDSRFGWHIIKRLQ